jgi:1,4-alpha-glucan branching enzyme
MKKHRNGKGNGNGSPTHAARFEFTDSAAKSVFIAGTFNDWRPAATEMVQAGAGRWVKELVLPPGVYEYRLVVDGAWIADPAAAETAPNPFGGLNSVIKVGRSSEADGAISSSRSPDLGRRE